MNIFSQYGIREVADVTIYSITRIDSEEFYIPMLYLDTLKLSTVEKNVTTVRNTGGIGNGTVLSWNFDKDLKLKLEDALFSQTSLNVYMNGRVMAKMADYTSAIAKLTVANKYGQKHYSTKAYPSPQLTECEWEIVYECAEKAGFDPRTGYTMGLGYNRLGGNNNTCKYIYTEDGNDKMVAENRWLLKDAYYKRTQKTPHSRDLSPYFDLNKKYESVSIILKDIPLEDELAFAKEVNRLSYGTKISGWRDLIVSYQVESPYNLTQKQTSEYLQTIVQLHYSIKKMPQGYLCEWAYISPDNIKQGKEEDQITSNIFKDLFTGYNKNEEGDGLAGTITPTYQIGNEFFLTHILYYIFPNYLEDALGDLCWCDMNEKFYKAMPIKIINYIFDEITTFDKVGEYQNDLYEIDMVNNFEKCVVKNPHGLKIDLLEQMQNIKKYYTNEQSTFIIYYDAKTMQPFMKEKPTLDEKILSQKCVRIYKQDYLVKGDYLAAIKSYFEGQYDKEWIDSLTNADYIVNKIVDKYGDTVDARNFEIVQEGDTPFSQGEVQHQTEEDYYLVYFTILKHEYLHLKYGTVYYKFSRTVDEDENDITFLGTDLSIDVDTFPGEYLITGNTYIRDERTGKDVACQITINRAAIASTAKLNLQAAGQPTTFSLDVTALMPYDSRNKSMVEIKTYKSEEDTVHGGTRIVPQNKRHVYTKTDEVIEKVIGQNVELY